VLAPVQVAVVVERRVLVVQLGVDRPQRADELAEADGAKRRILGAAIAVLELEARRTGQVPAVVELLRGSRLGHRKAAKQRSSQTFLVPLMLLDGRGNNPGGGTAHASGFRPQICACFERHIPTAVSVTSSAG